jgi:hypothetical protein
VNNIFNNSEVGDKMLGPEEEQNTEEAKWEDEKEDPFPWSLRMQHENVINLVSMIDEMVRTILIWDLN